MKQRVGTTSRAGRRRGADLATSPSVVGRISLFCALLLAGCELNPHGELPSGDNGAGPPMISDSPTGAFDPSLPVEMSRPELDPIPLPDFPSSDSDGDNSPVNEGAEATDDVPPAPSAAQPEDDETPEEGPIFSADAGAVSEATDGGVTSSGDTSAQLPGASDAGGIAATDMDTDNETGIDLPVFVDAGADAGADAGGLAQDRDAAADAGPSASDGGTEDGGSSDASAAETGDAALSDGGSPAL